MMRKKRKEQKIQIFLGVFLIAFVFCILPQYRADAAAEGILQICAGGHYGAAVKKDGSLWLWGDNYWGQIGNGSTGVDEVKPVKVMSGVQSVSLGESHSAALKKDGSLWLWGDNDSGQLGNGSTKDSSKPVKVMSGVQSVSLGRCHSAAVKKDGSLWMWGLNDSGQLGNGSTKDSSKPVKVMSGVQSVSLGLYYSAAVKKDGSLWMWGSNDSGQLGNGSTKESSKPVKVMSGVQSVSLGFSHSAALKKDGSLWLWGANEIGQLGNGSTKDSSKPVKVMSGVQSVNLGWYHSAAVKKDGSLWMWGSNGAGALGNGSETDSSKPVKVMSGVQSASLGWAYSAAVKKDGSLWMWGSNAYGQFGTEREDSSKPVKVSLPASGPAKISISKCTITLSKKSYKYTGKAVKPLPTVKYKNKTLKNKTDYTLAYENNKRTGTATVVIKGKGSYTGQKRIKFTIKKDESQETVKEMVTAYEGLIRKSKSDLGVYFGCYDFDSDGIKELLLVNFGDFRFRVYDYTGGKLKLMGKGDFYNSFGVSRDGKYLISSNADIVNLYKFVNGKMKLHHSYTYPGGVSEDSKEYKEWIYACEIDMSSYSVAKIYKTVNQAVNALHKIFDK